MPSAYLNSAGTSRGSTGTTNRRARVFRIGTAVDVKNRSRTCELLAMVLQSSAGVVRNEDRRVAAPIDAETAYREDVLVWGKRFLHAFYVA